MYRPTPLKVPEASVELEGGGWDETLEVRGYQTGTMMLASLFAKAAEEAHTSGGGY
jgi:hypothetical protein